MTIEKAADLTAGWQLAVIEVACGRISELARDGNLGTPIEHLGRWKVRDVIAHLGGVHRWATRIIDERSMAGSGFKKAKLDGTELCDWFDEGAAALITTLSETDFADPCPNFNPGSERTVAWWARRQAHETAVHCWDVEKALDEPRDLDHSTAADGVDEFLDVFVRTRGKQTLTAPLLLRIENPEHTWLLTPAVKPGRIDVVPEPGAQLARGVTELSGPAGGLLLALWGRCTADQAELTIAGNSTTAHALVAL